MNKMNYLLKTNCYDQFENLTETSSTKWTDIYENLMYVGIYGNLHGLQEITTFHGGEDCFTSWHGYHNQKKGADHSCNDPKIGYICIDPWADALEAPKIKYTGAGVSYDDVHVKCAENGLYPLITQNLMDVKKVK